jgi:uncharacterized membrane protein
MVAIGTAYRSASEKRSSTLFFVAGVLLAGHAAVWGVRLVTDVSPPTGVFAAPGHLIAVVALVLLYPVLADRTPSLVRGAAIMAAIPTAGWFVITVEQLIEAAGILSPPVTELPSTFYLVVLVSTIIAYTLFAVVTRHTAGASRTLGSLLLAPPILLVAGFTAQTVIEASALTGFVTGSGLALSMFAIGQELRTTAADSETPAGGLTTG